MSYRPLHPDPDSFVGAQVVAQCNAARSSADAACKAAAISEEAKARAQRAVEAIKNSRGDMQASASLERLLAKKDAQIQQFRRLRSLTHAAFASASDNGGGDVAAVEMLLSEFFPHLVSTGGCSGSGSGSGSGDCERCDDGRSGGGDNTPVPVDHACGDDARRDDTPVDHTRGDDTPVDHTRRDDRRRDDACGDDAHWEQYRTDGQIYIPSSLPSQSQTPLPAPIHDAPQQQLPVRHSQRTQSRPSPSDCSACHMIWQKGGPACIHHRSTRGVEEAHDRWKAQQATAEAETVKARASAAHAAGRLSEEELDSKLEQKARSFFNSTFARLKSYGLQLSELEWTTLRRQASAAHLPALLELFSLRVPMLCRGPCPEGSMCPEQRCLVRNDLLISSKAIAEAKIAGFELDHSLLSVKLLSVQWIKARRVREGGSWNAPWDSRIEGEIAMHAMLGSTPIFLKDGRWLPRALQVRCASCHLSWAEAHPQKIEIATKLQPARQTPLANITTMRGWLAEKEREFLALNGTSHNKSLVGFNQALTRMLELQLNDIPIIRMTSRTQHASHSKIDAIRRVLQNWFDRGAPLPSKSPEYATAAMTARIAKKKKR